MNELMGSLSLTNKNKLIGCVGEMQIYEYLHEETKGRMEERGTVRL